MTAIGTPVVWAAVVSLVLWPRLAGRRAGFGVYVLTMALNELPLLVLAVLVVTTVVGGVDPPGGWPGLAWWLLWSFVVAGLLWAHLRACRARAALDAAFSAGLGPQWRRAVRAEPAPRRHVGRPVLAGVLLPFQRRRRTVERIRDVAYGPDPAHRLDVYRGRAPAPQRPVLIHFHEGGFVQGGRSRETVTLLNRLAAHGWLCLSADYRLREDAAFPNPLVDAKRVIAWARAHAAELGADAGTVVLVGGSAGGHIAVNAALTPGEARFQPGFEDADTSVVAAVSLYGYLGPRGEDPAGAPARLGRPDGPPLLLVRAANDTMLPAGGPAAWAASLRSDSGAPVVDAALPGAQHAFDLFASVRARIVAIAVEEFLAWVRSAGRTVAGQH